MRRRSRTGERRRQPTTINSSMTNSCEKWQGQPQPQEQHQTSSESSQKIIGKGWDVGRGARDPCMHEDEGEDRREKTR